MRVLKISIIEISVERLRGIKKRGPSGESRGLPVPELLARRRIPSLDLVYGSARDLPKEDS